MNLESHQYLHLVVVLFSYLSGQASGMLGAAYVSSKSSLNSIASIHQWFKARWIPVIIRWLMGLFMFFVVWENPAIFNIDRFMPTFLAHVGVAGFVGFASDQLVDKVLVMLFPGVQKELPPIPASQEQLQQTLQTAANATNRASEAIADAKTEALTEKKTP